MFWQHPKSYGQSLAVFFVFLEIWRHCAISFPKKEPLQDLQPFFFVAKVDPDLIKYEGRTEIFKSRSL
jgi:hypothetical protein